MRSLTGNRYKQGAASSRLLGVIVALWVSLGVQPCAVAAVGDSECPHCPPDTEQGMPAAHNHVDPGQQSDACVTSQSNCCGTDGATLDGRKAKTELNELGDALAAAPVSETSTPKRLDRVVGVAADPPDRRRSPVPLYVLYCVYRD